MDPNRTRRPGPESRASDIDAQPTPGRRTLTSRLGVPAAIAPGRSPQIQRKAFGARAIGAEPEVTAERGVAGAGTALPFRDQIQAAFGHHDVSSIQSYTSEPAVDAAAQLGAAAYATGNRVAFGRAPDLHTAAHEAAHVIQQRQGVSLRSGIGEHGDAYEQHADAVADAVVAGRSAEALLDQMAGGGGASKAIQRKDPSHGDDPAVSLPDGVNMQILSDATVVARAAWLDSDPAKQMIHGGLLAPNRMTEILHGLRSSGLFPWMDEARIPALAKLLGIMRYAHHGTFVQFAIAFDIYALIGPPPDVDILFGASGKGLAVVVRQSVVIPGPVTAAKRVPVSEQVRTRIWAALERHTKLPIRPEMKSALMDWSAHWQFAINPDMLGVSFELDEDTLQKIYGKQAWKQYLERPRDEKTESSGVVTIGGVTFSETVPEADRQYFLTWMKQLGPGSSSAAPQMTITNDTIAELRNIDADPLRAQIIAKLRGPGNGDAQSLDGQLLRSAINAAHVDQVRTEVGIAAPASGQTYKPLFEEPVRGTIVNRGGLNYVGQKTEFYWETQNKRDAFAVPHVTVQWALTKQGKPTEHLATDTTTYIETKGPDYFSFEWKETGVYTIYAFVTHTFYQPAQKSIDVKVETEAERMTELDDKAYSGLQGDTDYATGDTDWPFDVSTFNTLFGSHKQEYGKKVWGKTPADYQRLSYDERVKFLTTDRKQLEDLIAAHQDSTDKRWKDMVSYARDKLKTLAESERALTAESLMGNTFFDVRGTFLSRKNGVPDKALRLVGSARKTGQDIKTTVHDFTQLFEPLDYTFTGTAGSYEKAIEATFVDLCKSYPAGRVSCMFEALDDSCQPMSRTITFEFDTGTAWKDVKSVVYNPTVQLIVNIAGAVTMVFLPVTAPLLLPMLATYNSVDVIDNMADLSRKGHLTWGNVAKGVAQIGMNFLPYIGEVKAVAQLGKVAMYTLDGVMIAGQAVLMTLDGVEQIRRLRDKDISEVAELDSQVREIERTNPSDPQLPSLKKTLDQRIKDAQDESTRVLAEMAKSGSVLLVQMAALKGLQTHMTTRSVEGLKADGIFEHVDHLEPRYDPTTGTIRGDQSKLDTGTLAKLQQSYALDMAAKQAELANVLGTDKVEVTRNGDAIRVTQDGDGYKVELPKDRPFKEALDEAWKFRKASDPKAPAERPAPMIGEVHATLSAADVVTGRNVAIGNRVSTASEGHAILARLARGDRGAFKALGMDAPPHTFDLRSTEWGLGQMADGSFIIIRGEPMAVDWAEFKGVRPVAHSHPLTADKLLDGHFTFQELIKGGREKRIVDVFPSAADVAFTARNFLGEHTVQTPYASKGGGKIGNPTPGTTEPLVQIKIQQPERIGSFAGNDQLGVYKSHMVAEDTTGKVLWKGDVYTVDHPSGSLVTFDELPATLVTRSSAQDHGTGSTTPTGKHDGADPSVAHDPARAPPDATATPTVAPSSAAPEIPPRDLILLHQTAGDHVSRNAAMVKDLTPDGRARISEAAVTASEGEYQARIRNGQAAKDARKAAGIKANKAAMAAADSEAVDIATRAADQAISDGSVFDLDLLPADAKSQLAAFEGGRVGQAAARLAPELSDKSLPEIVRILDSEVASGHATKQVELGRAPADPTGTRQQAQGVYTFGDGTLIRTKLEGDRFNAGEPMFSIEVKQAPPSDTKPKQAGVAFKVDSGGRPVPKGKTEIKNPYKGGRYQRQEEIFEDRVLAASHQKART